MSSLAIDLPGSLQKSIKNLAESQGYSINQFLASAAGKKLAVMTTIDYLRREAEQGNCADFDKYLAAVPNSGPADYDSLD